VGDEGGVVKGSEQYKFQSLKKNIQLDVERLKRGEYSLSDLVEKTDDLGEWEGEKLLLKTGRFGDYVEWGENKKSIKNLNKPIEKVTREDILKVLNDEVELKTSNKILRVVNRDCSVRTGRFGAYVYYKPANYDKPKFLGIKKMPFGYMKCSEKELMDWLMKTYDI
jgi:DNA topoisomerase-1